MKTNVNVITTGKMKPTGKKVLLFSGGMDSVMFDKLLKPDILLYIPSGPYYEKIETAKIKNLVDRGIIDSNKLVILENVLNLSQFERDDAIVPGRNAFLILLAANYGETIYLGSVYGDRSFDKDEEFYKHMENLLNHMFDEQHFTEKRSFNVSSPFKNTTKTELLKMYLKEGGNIQNILDSYSCYRGTEVPCGICKPCVRKAVALKNVGYNIDNYFEQNPFTAPWIKEVWDLILEHKYRGREDIDMINAINPQG